MTAFLTLAKAACGRPDEAAQAGAEVTRLLGGADDPVLSPFLGGVQWSLAAGRQPDLASIDPYPTPPAFGFFFPAATGYIQLLRGNYQQAHADFDACELLEIPGMEGLVAGARGLARALEGDIDGALGALEQAKALPPWQVRPMASGFELILTAEALVHLDRPHEAAALHEEIVQILAGGPVFGLIVGWGLLRRGAGIAAAAGGKWEAATQHFETALRQAHNLSLVCEQPQVRYWYARMRLDRGEPGDREKARELLTEAIDLYREIGMPKHLEMAEVLLARA